jgi:hypothetical protein
MPALPPPKLSAGTKVPPVPLAMACTASDTRS